MKIPDLPPCSCKAEYRHRLHRLACWTPERGVLYELRDGLDWEAFADHVYTSTIEFYYEQISREFPRTQSSAVRAALTGNYTPEVSKEDIEKWAARQLEMTLTLLKGN